MSVAGDKKRIYEAKSKEEFTALIRKNKKCIVDFYGSWCNPCKKLGANLNKITDEMKDVTVIKVDVNDLDDIAARYEVTTIPHVMFYHEGHLMPKGIKTSEYTEVMEVAKDQFALDLNLPKKEKNKEDANTNTSSGDSEIKK